MELLKPPQETLIDKTEPVDKNSEFYNRGMLVMGFIGFCILLYEFLLK